MDDYPVPLRLGTMPCHYSVFQEFGEIAEIVILRDRRTNMHQVHAHVACTARWGTTSHRD